MAQGYSIHIGLNHVDTSAPDYQGVEVPELYGCINDADSMEKLANQQGFSLQAKLTDDQATASNVLGALGNSADNLQGGDILLLTYSGHGSQVPDQNGDEDDGQDETWVLWDRMLVDDELKNMWARFQAGVRIFVLSDSCHSGTVSRDFYMPTSPPVKKMLEARGIHRAPQLRRLEKAQSVKAAQLLARHHPGTLRMRVIRDVDIGASVLLISGCQDNQTSQDGDANGLFTQTLLEVWSDGAFQGNYSAFHSAILAKMPPTQSPNYDASGASNPVFEGQRPFTIDGASPGNGQSQDGGSGTAGAGSPAVSGPAQCSRSDQAPSFDVTPGANQYYVFEMASDSSLFPPGASDQRSYNTWYASYEDSDAPGRYTGSSYSLPDKAWEALKGSERLYYRIGTTSTADGWDNYVPSTYDDEAANAPSIEITD
jgi:metacaspase-1